nr:NACHT, LRR and PYD domains-containing protein 1a allele 4-like [Pocillopora verrucosa]
METVKLEGTSPLTVVPTTGHGKELEEPWGRKGKMASALAPSFRSSKETTNYARLCRLLVNVSAHILRETFDRRRPTGDLHTFLSSRPVHAVLQSLRKKRILSPLQWGKLYPAIKSAVSSKNFDITLLMVLLRNICGLVRPATGWDTLPPETDATLEADIVRIKCYRNTVYGHASQASVDDPLFNQYWQDIQDALVRLGGAGYQSAIDDLKKECMDPDFEEHYKELLKQWVVDEVSIKERLDETTEHFKESKEAIADPTKKFKAGEKAVAEYSDALKESIRRQTEYLVQASPSMSNVKTDHIFTNILMQHGRKPVEDLDVKRKERLRQYGQIRGKQIKSSQEIFIPIDEEDPESVLVTGKAGIGKTLFCQKLIRDWADNKLFRSRANAEVPDFKFAYLLTFRQLNLLGDDPVTLKDILNRSSVLDDHSNIDDSILEHILHHSEEVLIIIDGYDECSQREYIASDSDEKYPNNAKEKMPVAALCAKLIKGKILRGSVVMITSRPDESDEMKDREIYFDRYVEITGFSEPQVKEYIGKYFKNNERMKNIVMDHITKNVNLVSFAHIPVLCFLMCSYFEYILQQPKKNNPLPVKTSDLYDEVVNMFVQKHDRKKSASVEETLDELSKLAAQLLEERKFLFFKEDLKTLNLHEVESLCGSGLLHCGPPFRTSFSATTKHFCFTHLTLQEYLAARWFVKTRKIPPGDVSTEVVLFMSGILSKEKDNEFVEKLIIEKILSVLSTSRTTKGLLISKCLLEYEDIEFAKEIVKKFRNVFCPRVGHFDLSGFERTNVDCIAVSFALNVFGALNAEDESEWNRITTLSLSDRNVANFASLCQALQTPTCKVTNLHLDNNHITDAGVASLCQALQTPACKVTELELGCNQVTDAGVASICQALQTPTCKVTKLDVASNQITDAGVASLCQVLQTPTCKVTALNLRDNQVTDAGVASICQALQTPTCKVTKLLVGGNQITDAGVASLCQALQTPTCKVTELLLAGNQITDAGVASLCQALQTPTCKVTLLYLYGNQITNTAVNRLKYILEEKIRNM